MKTIHSQYYRERNEKICELIKQGNLEKVNEIYQLSDKHINTILRENGLSQRVTPELTFVKRCYNKKQRTLK